MTTGLKMVAVGEGFDGFVVVDIIMKQERQNNTLSEQTEMSKCETRTRQY